MVKSCKNKMQLRKKNGTRTRATRALEPLLNNFRSKGRTVTLNIAHKVPKTLWSKVANAITNSDIIFSYPQNILVTWVVRFTIQSSVGKNGIECTRLQIYECEAAIMYQKFRGFW